MHHLRIGFSHFPKPHRALRDSVLPVEVFHPRFTGGGKLNAEHLPKCITDKGSQQLKEHQISKSIQEPIASPLAPAF